MTCRGFSITIHDIKLLILKGEFDEALFRIEQSNENQLDMIILKSMVLRKKQMFTASIKVGKEALKEARESNSIIHKLGALLQLTYSSLMMHQTLKSNSYISEYDALWNGLSNKEKEDLRELKGYYYHLKGSAFLFEHDIKQGLKMLEDSLEIQNTVVNSIETLNTLNNLSWYHIWIGNYDRGQDYANQQLSLANNLENQYGVIGANGNLGLLEVRKGEYDLAKGFFTKGLHIANDLNLRFSVANLKGHIGKLHELQGQYDQALKIYTQELVVLEDLNMPIFASETIYTLISVCIKLGLTKQTENYMRKLDNLDESNQNKGIRLFKKLSHALILKNNPRAKDKIAAQNLYEEIIDESIDVNTSSTAILQLCELLLDELKIYGTEEVLEEIENKTRELYELAQKHKLYPLIVEILVLRAKLAFLKLDLDESTKILNQASMIAEERGLKNLVNLVEIETKKLETEIRLAAEITRKASTIQDRMNKAEIIDYIEKMQHLIKISQE